MELHDPHKKFVCNCHQKKLRRFDSISDMAFSTDEYGTYEPAEGIPFEVSRAGRETDG
jgi:hypothetical protein